MTDLQRDIEAVQKLVDAEALLPAKQAWLRLKASLSPDREQIIDAAHDAISRALDEASVRDKTHRGMCLEVGLEKFADAIAAMQGETK